MHKRQAIPIIRGEQAAGRTSRLADEQEVIDAMHDLVPLCAGIVQPPIPRPDAIEQVFEATRETAADLDDARSCWSVAQAPQYRSAS